MSKGKIGVQMMMLKQKVEEIGVYATMKKLRDIGFSSVEVSQIPMTESNVQSLKQASEDINISITALSAGLEPMLPGATGETNSNHSDKMVMGWCTVQCV